MFRASFLGEKTGQAIRLKGSHGLIEGNAGESKLLCRIDDRHAIDTDPSQHLVLDQQQVVRIEEFAVAKKWVDDSRRLGIEGALLAQGSIFGGLSLHGPLVMTAKMYVYIRRCQVRCIGND